MRILLRVKASNQQNMGYSCPSTKRSSRRLGWRIWCRGISFLVLRHGAAAAYWLDEPHAATTRLTLPSRRAPTSALHSSPPPHPVDKGFNLLETASGLVPQGPLVTVAAESWKLAWRRLMTELAPQDASGAYQRPSYIRSSPVMGIGSIEFPDEPGRYHVYTGNPCPWCHRVVLTIKLLGFSIPDQIGWTVLEDNPRRASRGGWIFSSQQPDTVFGGCRDLRQVYDAVSSGGRYKGRCTAPLLVDTKTKRIVSNESADICRMLNKAALGSNAETIERRLNLVPSRLQAEIDETNEWVYRLVNNGVYRCGFATTQAAYDVASDNVREGLRRCEERLQQNLYLCGNDATEADVRLLPTILRMDGVYAPLFRAGGAQLRIRTDYPAIYAWLKRCWSRSGVAESIDLSDACGSYYRQLFPLNPSGIVPTLVTAKDLGLE
jgi:glutathionyl-hydroquinone reductase